MTEQWEKQQREVDSYNVFFSAFKGRTEVDSLLDSGSYSFGSFFFALRTASDTVEWSEYPHRFAH